MGEEFLKGLLGDKPRTNNNAQFLNIMVLPINLKGLCKRENNFCFIGRILRDCKRAVNHTQL